MIFPFPSGISQMRNALMAGIVLYTLVTYITDENHSIVKLCIRFAVAVIVHPSAIFYFIFVLAGTKLKPKTIVVLTLVVILIAVESFITSNNMMEIASMFTDNERVLQYFDFSEQREYSEKNLNWIGRSITSLGICMGYGIFLFVYSKLKQTLNSNNLYIEEQEKIFSIEQLETVNAILMLTFTLVPLCVLDQTYFRLFKNITPLIYIVAAQYFSLNIGLAKEKVLEGRFLSFESENAILGAKNVRVVVWLGVICAYYLMSHSQGFATEMLNSFNLF